MYGMTGTAAAGRAEGTPGSRPAITQRYRDLCLSSHFQPIFSIAHRRAVGFEGLIRAQRGDAGREPPEALFARPRNGRELLDLDRICRRLHLRNFARQCGDGSWLFLNLKTVMIADRLHVFCCDLDWHQEPPAVHC